MNRFVEQDKAVIDTHTGLMWTRNASLSDFPMAWEEAFDFVKGLNASRFCGFNDWKLPNRRELFSLVSHEAVNPCLDPGHPFINVFTGYYWTSTSCVRLPDQAWYIHLGGARVFKGMKYGSYMAWPVRVADNYQLQVFQTGQQRCYDDQGTMINCRNTGQDGEFRSGMNFENPRFEENIHAVKDHATGLTWLKNANGAGKMLDWQSASDFVDRMNQEARYGYKDWRLPHIAELESLTDLDRHSPALPVDHPFSDVQDFYWSSTISRYDSTYVWALYMKDGIVGVGYKPLPEFYLWPVSGKSLKVNGT